MAFKHVFFVLTFLGARALLAQGEPPQLPESLPISCVDSCVVFNQLPSDWRTLDTLQEHAWLVEYMPSGALYLMYRQSRKACFFPLARTASTDYAHISWAKAQTSMPSTRYLALNWSHQSGQSGWQGGNAYRVVGLCIFDLRGCLVVDLVVHTSMETWTNTLAEPLTDSTTVMPEVIDSQEEHEEENIEVSFDGKVLTLRNGSHTRTYSRVRNTWLPEN